MFGCQGSSFSAFIPHSTGAELSGKVNKMDVTVDEDFTDEAQEWKITLVLTSERCSK